MVSFDFKGKRALVIGGSRGIGRGVVENLVLLGAETFYAARQHIPEEKGAKFITVDVNDENQIIDMFEELDKSGVIDIVINTAAINFCKKFNEINVDEWDQVERTNLRAAFVICQQAAIRMKNQKYGKIVNVSSIAGRHRSIVSGVHYVSTKSGLIGLTRYLATYWNDQGVRCNAICPGGVDNDQPKEFLVEVSSRIPMNRLANADEYQGTLVWMLSEASSYLNGAIIPVDGGRTTW